MTKCQTITGIYVPVFCSERPELIGEALRFLVSHTLDGTLRPNVSGVIPLSQTARAHRLLEERKVVGAVVLDPSL